MHLEPNNQRTPSNIKRLKLKGFHKRQILVKAIKNLFAFRIEKPRKEPTGSGSGGNSEVQGSFSYKLEEVEATGYRNYKFYKKRIGQTFNKQQLLGKLILIGKKYYRICSDTN